MARLLEKADFAATASDEWKLIRQATKGGEEELVHFLLKMLFKDTANTPSDIVKVCLSSLNFIS